MHLYAGYTIQVQMFGLILQLSTLGLKLNEKSARSYSAGVGGSSEGTLSHVLVAICMGHAY